MYEFDTDPFELLSLADARKVDEVCLRFERAWRAGENPSLEDFLSEGESALVAPALLWGLLRVEIEYRLQHGDRPSSIDYERRFPVHTRLIEAVFQETLPDSQQKTDSAEHESPQSDATQEYRPATPGPLSGMFHPEDFPIPFGEYILLEYIDSAGQGVVYKAKPVVGDDEFLVALKRIKTGVLASEGEVQRFKLEANALAQLNHPRIISIYHVGEYDGQYYFTMQFLEGGSIKNKLSELKEDPQATARLIAKVARGIDYAHKRGILHRDLKPGNILLDDRNEPLVIDFGLAKRLGGKPGEQGDICGTLNYMPLEQAEGNPSLTMAVDIYSLGAVLYHCLTGRPPYQAKSFAQLVHQMQHYDPPPPRKLNPKIPKELEAICLHCLKRDPDLRYETAEELAEDLESWLEDGPISILPESLWKRGYRWSRKHPAVAALSTFLILAIVVGTGMVWYFAIQANQEAYEKGLALEQAEWMQYLSQIDLAHRELLNGSVTAAKRFLKTSPEEFRNWEYRYLCHLYERLKPEELLHRDHVWSVSLNPKKPNQIATVTANGTLTVWNWRTKKKLLENESAHDGNIFEVEWSANGKWLATAGADGAVKLWDARSLTLLKARTRPTGYGDAWSVKFNPESDLLLAGWENGTLDVWQLQQSKDPADVELLEMAEVRHQNGIWLIEFSPDGKLLATASGAFQEAFIVSKPGELILYDVEKLRKVKDANLLFGATTTGLLASPLASAPLLAATALTSGIVVQELSDHKNACTSVAFSADGEWLVTTGYDKAINVYRLSQGQQPLKRLYRKRAHTDRRVISAIFNPNWKYSHYFVTGSWDKTVKLWDAESGQMIREFLDHRGPVASFAFSLDGEFLLTASGDVGKSGAVYIWDWEIPKKAYSSLDLHNEEVREVAFSPNKATPMLASASADGTIAIWDRRKGKKWKSLQVEEEKKRSPVNCIAFHPTEDKYLASGHEDGIVRLWDMHTGQVVYRSPEQDLAVLCVSFSPDGKHLAAGWGKRHEGRQEGHVRVWEMATPNKMVFPELRNQDSVFSVAFSPNGNELISTSGVFDKQKRGFIKGTVKLWSMKSGKLLDNLALDHGNKVECARFSPDGKLLATASSDQTVQLWDANTQERVHLLEGHTADVFSLAFNPDGTRLASAGLDHTVRLWDVNHGEEVLAFELSEECKSVAFSPDGRYLAAASADGTLRIYDSGPAHP